MLSGADALGKGEHGEVDQGGSRHVDKRSNAVALHSVTQILIKCEDERKWDEMVKFLEGMQPDEKVIVFVRSKFIHGWSDPGDREQALSTGRVGRKGSRLL